MPRKFIYFINPISGTGEKELLVQTISTRTSAQNIPYEIAATNVEGNYDYLKQKIQTEAITDVIVCGGDGTVNKIANALKGLNVCIGIIPMGSGNGLALAAGIPTNADKALQIIFDGHAAFTDGFYINQQFSCMLCGLGFDAQVAHDFAQQPKRGLITYAKQTVKNFFSAKPYPFIIKANGEEISRDAFFISIANSNQFGNNVTIAPKASICDGLLDVVVVTKMSKLKLLFAVARQIFRGQVTTTRSEFKKKDIVYLQTKHLQIDNLQHAPLHIDGDPASTAARFNVEIVENAFKLLQPA
ncbi:MAG: YegS/Rv2252/BmrU family lipid kinase [Chitinophagaceae bacterium]|nr:MAG: YegS/Rv2252/BmrU family lipid kinase [Chitinophagaceae bacterium]